MLKKSADVWRTVEPDLYRAVMADYDRHGKRAETGDGSDRFESRFGRGMNELVDTPAKVRDFAAGESDDRAFERQVKEVVRSGDPAEGEGLIEEGALGASEMLPSIVASQATGGAASLAARGAGTGAKAAELATKAGETAFWYAETAPALADSLKRDGLDDATARTVRGKVSAMATAFQSAPVSRSLVRDPEFFAVGSEAVSLDGAERLELTSLFTDKERAKRFSHPSSLIVATPFTPLGSDSRFMVAHGRYDHELLTEKFWQGIPYVGPEFERARNEVDELRSRLALPKSYLDPSPLRACSLDFSRDGLLSRFDALELCASLNREAIEEHGKSIVGESGQWHSVVEVGEAVAFLSSIDVIGGVGVLQSSTQSPLRLVSPTDVERRQRLIDWS